MLTIIQNLSATLSRPKCHPKLRHKQWVVWDSELKKRVFGPEPHSCCMKFIDKNEEKST